MQLRLGRRALHTRGSATMRPDSIILLFHAAPARLTVSLASDSGVRASVGECGACEQAHRGRLGAVRPCPCGQARETAGHRPRL